MTKRYPGALTYADLILMLGDGVGDGTGVVFGPVESRAHAPVTDGSTPLPIDAIFEELQLDA